MKTSTLRIRYWPLTSSRVHYLAAMRTICIASLVCLFGILQTSAQSNPSMGVGVHGAGLYDSSYIQSLTHYLTARVYFQGKSQVISMSTPGRSYDRVLYLPNAPVNIGAGVNYKWIGVSYALRFPFALDLTEKFGKTYALDIQVNIYSRRFAVDAYLQEYFGFFMLNPHEVFPGYDLSGPFPQRSDIRSLNIGTNLFWIFNHHHFSYRAAFLQTERQLRSAGSWLLGPTLGYYRIRADSALVPNDPIVSNPPREQFMRRGEFYSIGALGGYSYNFVWGKQRHWYVSPTAMLGFTYGDVSVSTPTEDIPNRSSVNARLNLRGAAGYNGQNYFWGFTTVADFYGIAFSRNLNITYTAVNYFLFFGRRFNVQRRAAKK